MDVKMAGFFGLFDYNKPGKGVSKDEPAKSRFFQFWELFFRKFWKLIQLNLLYIAFCLPIVTIGPATAGLTYVLRNMSSEQPVFLASDFWDAFKNNVKQSFFYSLFMLIAIILLSVALQFYSANLSVSPWMYVPLVLCLFVALLLIFMSFYIYLMIVTVDLPLRLIFKNAAILSIVCLKTNILTLLFTGLLVLATYLFLPISALFVIFITFSWIGFIICFNSYPAIKKYTIDPSSSPKPKDGGEDTENEMIFED